MTDKKKAVVKYKTNEMRIIKEEGKSPERQLAEMSLSAPVLNAVTTQTFSQKLMGEIDITEAVNVMREKVSNVNDGNLKDLEATLTAQTVSLNTIFNELARRSALNMGTNLQVTESYMRLALKAQSQCARTIEVLAAMKNPPVVFAKQANISHGHQQVNNGISQTNTPTHAENTINQPNELLEVNNGSEKMDNRATQTTISNDKAMATVESQHRGKDS